MIRLRLHFSGYPHELLETEFQHPLLAFPINAVRGRTAGAFTGCASFPWSVAVRGLTYLLVSAKCRQKIGEEHLGQPLLIGGKGSLASSLDAALRKKPLWMADMFGTDSRGEPIIKRLLCRSNPELKRPGPVSINLNPRGLLVDNISIYVAGEELMANDDLRTLLCAIGDQSKKLALRGEIPSLNEPMIQCQAA